jgi:hypothetical protein
MDKQGVSLYSGLHCMYNWDLAILYAQLLLFTVTGLTIRVPRSRLEAAALPVRAIKQRCYWLDSVAQNDGMTDY